MPLRQVFTPDPECAVRHRLYGTFKVSHWQFGHLLAMPLLTQALATHAQQFSEGEEAWGPGCKLATPATL